MCGISGIIDFNKRNRLPDLKNMNSSLRHRGPDDTGEWFSKTAYIGHRRLKILDLTSKSKQPMNLNDRFILTYNGEIYNYKELKKDFLNKYEFKSSGDTEVLLKLLHNYKESGLKKIKGMFSFALWDEKKQELLAARDPFGIKPFYFYKDKNLFYFASEIKAFFAAGIKIKPNYKKIHEFLRWGVLDYDDSTWFENIYSLKPGHYIKLNKNKFFIKRYYYLPEKIIGKKELDFNSAKKEFTNLITKSVKRHCRSDRSIGVHLSGGVDSSVISAVTSKVTGNNINNYTFGFKSKKFDERKFAEKVSKNLKIKNFNSVLNANEVEKYMSRVLLSHDEPFTSIRILAQYKLYETFSNDSTVIFDASGGDEIGAGYQYYQWPWFLDLLQNKEKGAFDRFKKLIKNNSGKNLTNSIYGSVINHEQPGTTTADGTPYLNILNYSSDFLSKFKNNLLDFLRPFKSHLKNDQYIDLMHVKLPRCLRYVDRSSMAFGNEARLPILDTSIVELAFCSSNDAKIDEKDFRKFMKYGSKKFFSKNFFLPNKRNVADPQKTWLKNDLKDLVLETIKSRSFKERGIFNYKQCLKYYDSFINSDLSVNSFGVFQLLIVEFWFRNLIDIN